MHAYTLAHRPLTLYAAGGIVYNRYHAMIQGRVLVRDAASISWDALTYQYGPQIHTAPR
jgi:hypothetical protein